MNQHATQAATVQPQDDDTSTARIPLGFLRFGHDREAGEDINARVTDRQGDVEALARSIEANGVLVPLLAVKRNDKLYVIDGNRRLAAMRFLKWFDDIPVPVIVVEAPNGRALEISFITNFMRKQLHPVDQYEAFAHINRPIEEIARDYGLTHRQVRQALALGSLSPKVRDAWRTGKISAEAAHAFTLAESFTTQERVLASFLKRMGGSALNVGGYAVRQELKCENASAAAKYVSFLGIEEFRAAGGKVVEDLFEYRHVVTNPDLAKQLANEKLLAICAKLVEDEGWAWAELREGVAAPWAYVRAETKAEPTKAEVKEIARLRKLMDDTDDEDEYERAEALLAKTESEINLRGYTKDMRADLGCFVWLEESGEVKISHGLVRPKEAPAASGGSAPAASSDKASTEAKENPRTSDAKNLSQALMQRLSETLTWAAADALRGAEAKVALAALLAGFTSPGDKTVDVTERGLRRKKEPLPSKNSTFAAVFDKAVKASLMDVAHGLQLVAAAALDFQVMNSQVGPLTNKSVAALCAALPAKLFNAALLKQFDAEDFFNSASAAIATAAIVEMGNPEPKGLKKPELLKTAVALQRKTGWLPKELRTGHYDGPSGKTTSKKAAVSKAKGKAK